MGKQPGVMFYFDIRPSLSRLSPAEKGQLFEAILDYAQYGAVPEPEGPLAYVWDFVRPRLDRDRERYEEIVQKRTEAVRKRWDREQERRSGTNEYTCIPTTAADASPYTPTFSSAAPPPADDYEQRKKKALENWEKVFGASSRT